MYTSIARVYDVIWLLGRKIPLKYYELYILKNYPKMCMITPFDNMMLSPQRI